jgi:hypothetical protein
LIIIDTDAAIDMPLRHDAIDDAITPHYAISAIDYYYAIDY